MARLTTMGRILLQAYNTPFRTTHKDTSFLVAYGREPPQLVLYTPGIAQTQEVETMLQERDLFLEDIRARL